MWKRIGFWVVIGLMVLSGFAVYRGNIDKSVSLSAAMEVWGDVLRDVDQLGLQVTRVSDKEEMEIGRKLAAKALESLPPSADAAQWEPYVTAVGQSLAPALRRPGIHYDFHVVDAYFPNAFALPGGQVFLTTGMLRFLESEAELAAILGHEMAHVDQRHCIENYQVQATLKRVGLENAAPAAELPRRLLAAGYSKYQELEADATGMRLMIEAGYDPQGCVQPFERLRDEEGEPQPAPREPVGELSGSLADALGSYFHSHPPSAERIARLQELIAQNGRKLAGKSFYKGVENFSRRIPKTQQTFPGEFTHPAQATVTSP